MTHPPAGPSTPTPPPGPRGGASRALSIASAVGEELRQIVGAALAVLYAAGRLLTGRTS